MRTRQLRQAVGVVWAFICALTPAIGAGINQVRAYDIPAGDGDTALDRFTDQSGYDVAYTAAVLRRIHVSGIKGRYHAEDALRKLFVNAPLDILRDEQTGAFLIKPKPAGSTTTTSDPSPPMKTRSVLNRILGSLALSTASLQAQPPPEAAPATDEVLTLSAFRVSTSPTNEYLAADSITGTRVASKLYELPFAVTAVTSEFMNDFMLMELNDQLATVSGFSPNENENNYQLRGFASGTTLVDGFRWIGSTAATFNTNVDRIEVIKGAVASIYGQINPGGVINTITRKPQARAEQGINLLLGSLDNQRATVYSTGPLGQGKKFFYRADFSYQHRDYVPQFADQTQNYASLQFAWRPSQDTNFNLAAAWIDSHKHVFVGLPINSVVLQDPYRPVGRTYTLYTGLNYDLFDFSYQGPGSYQDSQTKNLRATFEHRFNSVISLRAGLNAIDTSRQVNRQAGNTYAVATRSMSLRPIWQDRDQTGVAAQIDTLAEFSTGRIAHKLLFTLDYNREKQGDYNLQMSNANRLLYARQPVLLPDTPIYGYDLYRDHPGAYDEVTTDEKVGYSVFGAFLSERAALFDNRVILMVGGRYDKVYTDPTTGGVGGKDYWVSDFTYQSGVTFRLTPGVSLYANKSTSFNPQANLDLQGNPLPNEQGGGHEFGVKMTLLKDKLNLSLNRFQVDRKNIATLVVDPETLIEDYVLSTHERSNGYEVDLNWQVTDQLQILGGYGFTEARAINNASAAYLTGLNVLKRVPENNLGFAARYKFGGPLKGLIATANVRWLSESIINIGGRTVTPTKANPVNNIRFENGLLPYPNAPEDSKVSAGAPVRLPDGRESIYNGASVVWDFGLGYSFKARKRFTHKLRLNVKNAFDEKYVYGAGNAGDRRGVYGEYSLRF